MAATPALDDWKDDFLARPSITISEFNALVAEQQTWLLEHKHIFYNAGSEFKNLLHARNKTLNETIKASSFASNHHARSR